MRSDMSATTIPAGGKGSMSGRRHKSAHTSNKGCRNEKCVETTMFAVVAEPNILTNNTNHSCIHLLENVFHNTKSTCSVEEQRET